MGFLGSPDLDTYIGVSSVYLLMAEQMGIVGVVVFLLTMAIFFFFVRARKRDSTVCKTIRRVAYICWASVRR